MVVAWRTSACCMVPALTFGLPSRSPPIQLPICTYEASARLRGVGLLVLGADFVFDVVVQAGSSRRKVMR